MPSKFTQQIGKKIQAILLLRVPKKLKSRFREIKAQHIQDVLNDPLCQEIARGETGSSDFLEEGNLFSFFGFKSGSDPLTDLENFLNRHISLQSPSLFKKFSLKSIIRYPDEATFEKGGKLQLPWGGGSWPVRLERGLPNLKKFIPLRGKGLSQGGLQLKTTRGKKDWKGVPFIKKYRKQFQKDIERIKL